MQKFQKNWHFMKWFLTLRNNALFLKTTRCFASFISNCSKISETTRCFTKQRVVSENSTNQIMASIWVCRNPKNWWRFKIFLESCQVTSKLSVDSFMGLWDLLVAQKSYFKKKFFQNGVIPGTPPWLVNCVIYHAFH